MDGREKRMDFMSELIWLDIDVFEFLFLMNTFMNMNRCNDYEYLLGVLQ